MGDPALIITDGGLGGLLACMTAGARAGPPVARGAARGGVAPTAKGKDPQDGNERSAMDVEGVATAWIALPADRPEEHARRVQAAEMGAELSQIGHVLRSQQQAPSLLNIVGQDEWRRAGSAITAMLMSAGQDAMTHGLSRIVWPINLGRVDEQGRMLEGAVSMIAEVMDRAAATARLLTLDADERGLVIALPYVDFADAQMADLAADLDLPLHACYLGQEGTPERARWETLLVACGVSGFSLPMVARSANPRGAGTLAATAR